MYRAYDIMIQAEDRGKGDKILYEHLSDIVDIRTEGRKDTDGSDKVIYWIVLYDSCDFEVILNKFKQANILV